MNEENEKVVPFPKAQEENGEQESLINDGSLSENNVVQFPSETQKIQKKDAIKEKVYHEEYVDDEPEEETVQEEELAHDPNFVPQPIIEYRNKKFLAAGLLLFLATLMAVVLRNMSPFILVVGSLYYMWDGITAARRYHMGKIYEVAVICSGVKASERKNRVLVTFREEKDDGTFYYHKFYVQGAKNEDAFIVNAPYVIYWEDSNPNYLIAYIVI